MTIDDAALPGFELLHPAVQHHIVNSFGWRSLRPLQDATIRPILMGGELGVASSALTFTLAANPSIVVRLSRTLIPAGHALNGLRFLLRLAIESELSIPPAVGFNLAHRNRSRTNYFSYLSESSCSRIP